jgi:hypothetical protein
VAVIMVEVGVTVAVDTAAGSLGVVAVVASATAGIGVVRVSSDGAALPGACGGKSAAASAQRT